ncbi:muramoyltetrapeptide carboxypeptidase [Apibacter mensalis]|uniref:Muramoyltetrapeptide carboxypeptidase n=1 Tax=Apibacter mensalis TaxID=1586267 RepID=A0A0X3AN05_9FLAO|nr:LD-carboxypeptidase [Apibacter mensalis]CVK15623.1 muramoyltetrapeptide carboxypeptidase [Apibacter mensalis]
MSLYRNFIKPIKKGDTFLIIAPAGAVQKEDIQPAIDIITKQGWNFEIGKNTFKHYYFGYNYSGTVKERLEDLQWALDHPQAKAIWFARGGYGGVQIVDFLKLNNFKKNPKWLIGYSDNTVFHQHFNRRGIPTLHATVCKSLPQGQSEETYTTLINALENKKLHYEINSTTYNKTGKVEGILTGGNLSVLYSLLGSRSLDHFEDKILFIEDWYENYYHIDRMLIGMKRAGVLNKIKGLVVGAFTKMDSKEENKFYHDPFDQEAYKIISLRFQKYNIPMAFSFPSGHIFDTRALMMGGKVILDIQNNKVKLSNEILFK